MQFEAWVFFEPQPDFLMLVRAVVVQDEVQFLAAVVFGVDMA